MVRSTSILTKYKVILCKYLEFAYMYICTYMIDLVRVNANIKICKLLELEQPIH